MNPDLVNLSSYLRLPVRSLKKYDDDTDGPGFSALKPHRVPVTNYVTQELLPPKRKSTMPVTLPSRFHPILPRVTELVDTRSLQEIHGMSSRDIGRFI